MNSDFVVKYVSAWNESKVIDRQIVNYSYIQMEMCSQNLKEVIQSMKTISDHNFQTFKYWISCHLFQDLTQCVHYLHSLTPPVIHRDLNPENVLISDGNNGKFLKLCDFGLSKFYQGNMNTPEVGHPHYMAPEVRDSDEYDLKSDIYSLALIATEIFSLEYKSCVRIVKRQRNLYANNHVTNQN